MSRPEPGSGNDAGSPAPPPASDAPTARLRAPGWIIERDRTWWLTLLGAWAAGRVLVALGVGVAARFADRVDSVQPGVLELRWWAWDASWYDRMTGEGWAILGPESYRFFPGYPLAAEPLAVPFGHRFSLFAVSWAAALVGIALAGELTRRATGDELLARRVMVLTGIFPAALSLVMPYSEPLALVLIGGALLALLDRRWVWVAGLSLLASVVRPTGVLLAAPIAVEAWRAWSASSTRARAAIVAALAAPAVGLAAVFAWVGVAADDWGLPLSVQRQIRGGFLDPVRAVGQLPGEIAGGNLSDGVNLVFVLLLVAGAVGMWRVTMPDSLRLFGIVSLLVALSANNIDSLGRYGLVTTPLVVGLVAWLPGRRSMGAAIVVSAVGLVLMTVTSQWGLVVP
ncbi:MAG: hypothetical protein R2704_00360 [Microthrixaceae bacterium]